ELAPTPAEPAGTPEDVPVAELAPTQPESSGPPVLQPAPEVGRYRATGRALPPEVAALGEAEQQHSPPRLLTLPREQPAAFAALRRRAWGVCRPRGVATWSPPIPLSLLLSLVGTAAGLVVALWPFVPLKLVTYLIYPDALVLVEGGDFTVLPWGAVAGLVGGR